MNSSSENKLTIAILYIANYVALIIFVIMFLLRVIDFSSPIFLLFLFAPLVLFAIDTRMIKEKWYHFLGCTLPCAIVTIIMTAIVYFAYNSGNESALRMTSIEALINFMIFHFYASATLLWSSAGTMFKYKKYVKKLELFDAQNFFSYPPDLTTVDTKRAESNVVRGYKIS